MKNNKKQKFNRVTNIPFTLKIYIKYNIRKLDFSWLLIVINNLG